MSVAVTSLPLARSPSPSPPSRERPLPLPRAVLFDLDGTLVDTMPTLADLATVVMGRHHGTPRPLARELYLATCGLPFTRQLAELFPGDARNSAAATEFEARKPALCRSARMSADTVAALGRLRERGARVIVSSNNGRANVASFARGASFPFDLVLGFGNGLAKGRPHIEQVELQFGIGRQQMLFVGDSLHDGEMAEAEGMPFVAVSGTFSRERFALRFPEVPVISRVSELPPLFV